MQLDIDKLKIFLLDSGRVSKKDITEAETKAKKEKVSIGDILINENKISEEILRAKPEAVNNHLRVDFKNQQFVLSLS